MKNVPRKVGYITRVRISVIQQVSTYYLLGGESNISDFFRIHDEFVAKMMKAVPGYDVDCEEVHGEKCFGGEG